MKKFLARLRHAYQKRLTCQIPRRFFGTVKFPHPVGIVIGDGVQIGRNCRIYQNVTLGLREHSAGSKGAAAYPEIADDVTIYAGAVIAGKVRVGANSSIGANAVITKDVPQGVIAFGHNQFIEKKNQQYPQSLPRAAGQSRYD